MASTKAATSWFVVRSRSATRSGVGVVTRARIALTVACGIVPTAAHPSNAASSTASHASSFASSTRCAPSQASSSAESPIRF